MQRAVESWLGGTLALFCSGSPLAPRAGMYVDTEVPTSPHLARARSLARILDRAVTIPGTKFGVGLDGLIGLFPGYGDAIGGALSIYVIYLAYRAGTPASVLARMGANVLADVVVGGVPLLGDLFDFGFKANTRNVRLLERAERDPRRTRRAGRLFLAALLLVLVLLLVGVVVAVTLLIRALGTLF